MSKSFEDMMALSDLPLSIVEDHVAGMFGPSGSDKSMVFNVIAAIFPPTSG